LSHPTSLLSPALLSGCGWASKCSRRSS
jgi:hypothetical protein